MSVQNCITLFGSFGVAIYRVVRFLGVNPFICLLSSMVSKNLTAVSNEVHAISPSANEKPSFFLSQINQHLLSKGIRLIKWFAPQTIWFLLIRISSLKYSVLALLSQSFTSCLLPDQLLFQSIPIPYGGSTIAKSNCLFLNVFITSIQSALYSLMFLIYLSASFSVSFFILTFIRFSDYAVLFQ